MLLRVRRNNNEPKTNRCDLSATADASTDESAESTSLSQVLACERARGLSGRAAHGSQGVDALWAFMRAGRLLALRQPLSELFQTILDLSLEAVGAERGVLLTLEEGHRLVAQASRGAGLRISRRVCNRVLNDKASLLIRRVRDEPKLSQHQSVIDQGVQSLIAAPVQTEDRVIGLLYLDFVGWQRTFTRDDLELLTVMANVAALRIEREQWEAQRRTLMAENLERLRRVAAALSHELNTPLGVLKSTVDTLLRTASRRRSAPTKEQARLDQVQGVLSKSLDDSMTRMEQVIERLQRFTSLDRAEHQLVDLNQLVADVVAFAQEPVLEIRLKTVELPPLYCHRASLTTSVASVLRSVCEGCRIPGGCRRVDIHTRICDGWVEVHISCRSKRFATEDIEALFNPSFQTADGRISSGDWSLFAARQVIEGLGGEVRVCSAPNKATTFTIKLPAGAWAIPSQKTECASHEAAPAVG